METEKPIPAKPSQGIQSKGEDRGAGVPPAAFLPVEQGLTIRSRRLPHWEINGAIYFVTFRLADSLPKRARQEIIARREDILATAAQMKRQLTAIERQKLVRLNSRRIERTLDGGAGHCSLLIPEIARVVADALKRFDGARYRLFAWCAMPNHVHVLFQAAGKCSLAGILHSWKSYSAKAANKILGRTGEFWFREYYDHLIRDQDEFQRARDYILDNPGKVGLKEWTWVWSRE